MQENSPAELVKLANRLLARGAYADAESQAKNLIASEPGNERGYLLLGRALRGQNRQREITAFLDAASKAHPELCLWRAPNFLKWQEEAHQRKLPSIFLNTQFKSGSVFLRDALSNGLNMPWMFLFPEGVAHAMVDAWQDTFRLGGTVCQDHRVFSPEFADTFQNSSKTRLVVHLRDPRQSQLSVVHHYERVLEKGPDYARENLLNSMPIGYEDWPLEKKIDLQLGLIPDAPNQNMTKMHQNLEGQINWVQGWVAASLDQNLASRMIVSDYNDLLAGQESYIHDLLEKLEINPKEFDFSTVEKRPEPGVSHFRKGDPDEWRSTFSARQHKRASELMTPELLSRYGR